MVLLILTAIVAYEMYLKLYLGEEIVTVARVEPSESLRSYLQPG